ncbi:Rho termination factor N-terminal domain-containing protein, partial [Nocardia farcinica]
MSEHTDVARSGLTGMLLPQLRALAGELGIRGTSGMRKGDLIAAIKENQAGRAAKADKPARSEAKSEQTALDVQPAKDKTAPAESKAAEVKDAAPTAQAAAPTQAPAAAAP